jgi:UDP-N-acetylglucosamine 1-carboxyvinyltransferase
MVLSILCKGTVQIENIPFESMKVPFIHLESIGAKINIHSDNNSVSVDSSDGNFLRPFEVACGTYPGIISDMQPFFVLMALGSSGKSTIYDYRYPDRTVYLKELAKFCPGALSWESGKIIVNGSANFVPGSARATDLRGGMAILIAAILSGGPATIDNINEVHRGYNNLTEKLIKLGVKLY